MRTVESVRKPSPTSTFLKVPSEIPDFLQNSLASKAICSRIARTFSPSTHKYNPTPFRAVTLPPEVPVDILISINQDCQNAIWLCIGGKKDTGIEPPALLPCPMQSPIAVELAWKHITDAMHLHKHFRTESNEYSTFLIPVTIH